MASISYDYPYMGGRFDWEWGSSRVKLNGNYTYPIEFNTAIPQCKKLSVKIYVYSNHTSVFNRSWDLYAYIGSSWVELTSFTLPSYEKSDGEDEKYSVSKTVNVTVSSKNISKLAAVPGSTLNSSYTWSQSYDILALNITENIPEVSAEFNGEFCGISCTGINTADKPVKIMANIDGELVSATDTFFNVSGTLVPLKKVLQCSFKPAAKEERILIGFKGIQTGIHNITVSGIYTPEFIVLDSNYQPLVTEFYIKHDVGLEADKQYYVLLIDYPHYDDLTDAILKISV